MKKQLKIFIEPPATKGAMALIAVPPEVADEFLEQQNKKRMILHFDNGRSFHRALVRNKDGFCFIILGKSTLREAKKEVGTYQTIWLEKDKSKYGMPMPEEFEEVLRQDEEGRQLFEELTPGMKRSFLFYIHSAKSVDTRINRSLKLLENLKIGLKSAGRPQ